MDNSLECSHTENKDTSTVEVVKDKDDKEPVEGILGTGDNLDSYLNASLKEFKESLTRINIKWNSLKSKFF